MKWRSPGTTGWSNDTYVKHVLELSFGNLELVWWKAAWSSRTQWTTCEDMVGDMFHSGLLSCRSCNVGVIAEESYVRS